MKTILISILIVFLIMSCRKDLSPIEGADLSVRYSAKIDEGVHEFIISNDSGEPVWYWGPSEGHPLYQYAVLKNMVWEKIGPGWCGTGLEVFRFDSGESFKMTVTDPWEEGVWRLGVYLMLSPEGDEKEIWSKAIN